MEFKDHDSESLEKIDLSIEKRLKTKENYIVSFIS
jgi:hypothetical protein